MILVSGLDDTGIVSCYPFNNSANDYYGRYNGTTTSISYSPGYIGNGSYYNGSARISYGSNTHLYINQSGTIDLWVNVTNILDSDAQVIFSAYTGSQEYWSSTAKGFFVVGQNNRIYLFTRNGSSSGYFSTNFPNTTQATIYNKTIHLAFTWDYNITTSVINTTTYYNGTKFDSDQGSFGGANFSFTSVRTGSDTYTNYFLEQGTIDELHFWNVRKNDSDILSLSQLNSSCSFNSTTPAALTSSNLIWEIRFDQTLNDTLLQENATSWTSGLTYNTTTSGCIVGQCLLSDGLNENIRFRNTSIWRSQTNITSFTINMWVYERDNSTSRFDRLLWANASTHSGPVLMYDSGRSTGTARWQISTQSGTTRDMVITTNPDQNVWRMETLTYDGTTFRAYRNGVLGNTSTYTTQLHTSPKNIWVAGQTDIDTSSVLNGSMDELTFWNTTLTADNITQLYNAYLIGIRPISTVNFSSNGSTPVVNATPTVGDIYISKINGLDSNSGNSTHPIQTLTKLFTMWSTSEDVYFACGEGEIWRQPVDGYFSSSSGTSRIPSGTSTNLTIIRTYGSCNLTNRPKFTTSRALQTGNWTNVGTNLWKLAQNPGVEIANMIFNTSDIARADNPVGYRLKDSRTINQINVYKEWWQNRTYSGSGDYAVYIYSPTATNPVTYYNGIDMVYADRGLGTPEGTAFQIWTRNYIQLDGIEIMYADNGYNSDGDNNIVNNTYVHHIGGGYCRSGCTGFTRWGNGIMMWNDADNAQFTNNKFWILYDGPLAAEAYSGGTYVANNRIIANNIVIGTDQCTDILFYNTAATLTNHYFVNNTCYKVGYDPFDDQRSNETDQTTRPTSFRFGGVSNVNNVVVKGNLFYNSMKYIYSVQQSPLHNGFVSNHTVDYNYIYHNGTYGYTTSNTFTSNGVVPFGRLWNGTYVYNLAQWRSLTNKDINSISTYYSPTELFVDPENSNYYLRNYTLKYTSLCVGGEGGSVIGALSCEVVTVNVTGLTSPSQTSNSIYLSWDALTLDTSQYTTMIYLEQSNIANTTNAYYNSTGLTKGITYNFTVVHVTSAGSGANQTLTNSTVGNTAPTATIYFSPITAYFNDTVSCLLNSTDEDDDYLMYNGSAYLNGELQYDFDGGTSVSECIQYSPQTATFCGGLATGDVQAVGSWQSSYPATNAIDGNTATAANAINGATAYLYLNYTKPNEAVSTNSYMVVDVAGTIISGSVPESCFVYDSDDLILRLASHNGGSDYVQVDCLNNTGWVNIINSASFLVYSSWIYDFYVNWIMDAPATYYSEKNIFTYSNNFTSGDLLSCVVNVNDGVLTSDLTSSDLTVSNYVPVLVSVNIDPGLAYSNVNLVCQANATDAENNGVNYLVDWYVNGVFNRSDSYSDAVSGVLTNISTVSASVIEENQNWSCVVSVNDGFDFGSSSLSDSILILPDYITDPVIISPTNGSVVTNTINVTWNITYSIGVPVHNYTLQLLDASGTFINELAVGIYENYYYLDLWALGITPGNYHLKVIANDTSESLTSDYLVAFTANITTTLNVTAFRPIASSYVNSFNVTVVRGSESFTETTTDGFVALDIERNKTYNITVMSDGYYDVNVTNYALTGGYADLMFNLSAVGSFTLNIAFYDEHEPIVPVNFTTVYMDFISDYYANNYTTSNGTISITDLELATYTIRYYASGYSLRFYTLTVSSTSGGYNLDLYLINQSSASNITVYLVNELGSSLSNYQVKALKYYLTTNSYVVQEIGVTGVAGTVTMSLTKGDEYYKFMVTDDDGILKKTTDPAYITSDTLIIPISDDSDYYNIIYSDIGKISNSLTYNDETDNFRLDYTYSDNVAMNNLLVVYSADNLSRVYYNSTNSTSSSGTLLLPLINPINGSTYIAYYYFYDSRFGTYRFVTSVVHKVGGSVDRFGRTGLLVQAIITLSISSLVFINPPAGMILAPASLVIGGIIGLHTLDPSFTIGLTIVGIIVAFVVMKK